MPAAVLTAAVDAVADQPGGRPAPGRGAGRRPGRVDGRGATGGRSAGRRAARPRRGRCPSPACARCGRTGEAADPLADRWGVRPLPAPATRRRLRPLRGDQTGRRPRRAGPAGLRALRRPTATALRTVRTDPADRPPRPRRPARHLRRLLPAARGGLQPLRAPPAVFVRAGPNPICTGCAPRAHRGLRALRRRTAHRPPAGPRDRSATPATPPRCAAAAPAPAARPSGAWSPHPARTPPPAPTAPALPVTVTPAPTAASRTSSTNAAGAHPARCVAAPGELLRGRRRADPARAGRRSTTRSPPPTPRAPR